jgi:hypothetical protein
MGVLLGLGLVWLVGLTDVGKQRLLSLSIRVEMTSCTSCVKAVALGPKGS